MIWLSSFPRSGNTFLRNILFEVYGLASSTYHLESEYPLDENFESYPFVKSHEPPDTLDSRFPPSTPAIYLVRDGRDVISSMAHHRSNLIAPGSDLIQNMREAIVAERGSFFGGWSNHVEAWVERADLVIRYEDLVRDPIGCTERIRSLMDLPEPEIDRLPTFEKLKFGIPEYGAGRHQPLSEEDKLRQSKLFFRRGQAGAWKTEIPESLQELFWSYHGEAMQRLGYSRSGELFEPHPDLDADLRIKIGLEDLRPTKPSFRVLMEADKLVSGDNDGIKRYQVELLRALYPAVCQPGSRWTMDICAHGKVLPLRDLKPLLFKGFKRNDREANIAALEAEIAQQKLAENRPNQDHGQRDKNPDIPSTDAAIKALQQELVLHTPVGIRIERFIVGLIPRSLVHFLHRHNITLLHSTYERCRAILTWPFQTRFKQVDEAFESIKATRSNGEAPPRQATEAEAQSAAETEPGQTESPDGPDSQALQPYQLIHIPLKQNFRPFIKTAIPKLITFHDLTHELFPKFHTRTNIRNSLAGVHFAEKTQAEIIAVSESTRQDILKHTGISPEKTHLVYEAADPRLFHQKTNWEDRLEVRRKYGIDFTDPFLICLSTLEPRKNLINTIRAFVNLKHQRPGVSLKLVIAGKKGWDSEGIYALTDILPKEIIFTGFIDDKDLPYLYSDAVALSYLSYYEGFGLPALEAMRCGTPVIFGNNSALAEVVGNGGLPADPDDLKAIQNQFLRLAQSPELREELSQAAIARANEFSWRKAAIETLALYERLIVQGA